MQNAKRKTAQALAFFAVCILPPAFGQFTPALPGYEFDFPRDHGAHDEYKTEWWYYTGHLRTDDGRRYGFELTFFRVGMAKPATSATPLCPPAGAPGGGAPDAAQGTAAPAGQDCPPTSKWDLHNVALAHFAVSDIDGKDFRSYEKLNRASPFTANAAAGKLNVFNEGWRATTLPDGSWRIAAVAGKDSLDLVLRTLKPPAVHGENGISVKAAGLGYASHYYSMTRLEGEGRINGRHARGLTWMDHEFGSSQLRENQQGWDWFSIQFDNDAELMLYQIRRRDGTPDLTSSGSLITSDGTVIHLRHDQMQVTPLGSWHSPKSGATYPMGWRVAVPAFRIEVTLQPLLRDQELLTRGSTGVTYWEGAVDVSGRFDAVAIGGEGYVEMTGYDRAFRAP
jgi:predicted secreted hydrolase